MDSETVAIVVAAISSVGAVLSYAAQRKTAKENRLLQKDQVESQAYNRAREHYDAIINDLNDHIAWLKGELAEQTQENGRLKARIEALEKTVEALRNASVIVIEPPNQGEVGR